MAITSYLEGVPNTLITSNKWSRLFCPINMGILFNISNTIHPTDHRSICVVYELDPNINYGAR